MEHKTIKNGDTRQQETYTVQELIRELVEDDSWEPDPQYRAKAVGLLLKNVFPSC